MSDLKQLIDDLDTGLPEHADLAPLRAAGRRARRRRQGLYAVGGVAVLALAVPAAITMTGSSPDRAEPAPATPPAAELGESMRAAVEAAAPDATFVMEELTDGFTCTRKLCEPTAQDPPQWDTLVGWAQSWKLASGATLTVSSDRTSPFEPIGGSDECYDAYAPVVTACKVQRVGDRIVVVRDGIQYGQEADHWNREIEVFTYDGQREMDSMVSVGEFTVADDLRAARADWLDEQTAIDLALEESLVLPEPERYPAQG